MKLNGKQVVANTVEHREFIAESHIMHGKMLGITKSHTKYGNKDHNFRDLDAVNKHLTNAILAVLGTQDEALTTSENVEIHAPKEYHHGILALLAQT